MLKIFFATRLEEFKRPVVLLCTSGEASIFVIFKVGFGEENPYPSIL